MWSWIIMFLSSMLLGVFVTLIIQFYFLQKYFTSAKIPKPMPKLSSEPFQLPQSLLQTLRTSSGNTTQEGCAALNVLFQFLFHELRDTEKVRKWFRNKLTVEFEELLTRTAIGRMFGSIKVRDINLGSEFPIINGIVIEDVKINEEFSHVDSLDLKLDLSYKGGFRLIVDANMLLGKTAYLSIKVGELEGHARLQFTRLPYSHWSFSFYEEPRLELDVESQFQGRPLHQITTLISNQIRKSVRKKHTLPNFKLRYKPFFSIGEESFPADEVPPCLLNISIHHLSRLHQSTPKHVYCLVGVDPLPWIDIINYGDLSYYALDVTVTKRHSQPLGITCKQEYLTEQNKSVVMVESSSQVELLRGDVIVSIDGRKVAQTGQVPKLMRSAAVQVTVRVERRAPDTAPEMCPRKLSVSEGDSSGSSSISASPAKQVPRTDSVERKRSRRSIIGKLVGLEVTSHVHAPRLVTTKTVPNNQIIILDEAMKLGIASGDRYVNIAVRASDPDQPEMLVGYVNLPLAKLLRSPDSLHCCLLKPPDSFAASNSRSNKLSSQNGFIPLLSYGDVVLSVDVNGTGVSLSPVRPEVPSSPTPEHTSRPSSAERRHDFVRTHLQSSTQCQFCGKKIWFKDAEQCRDCGMTCHKKCVTKCKSGTVCTGVKKAETALGALGSMTAATVNTAFDLAVDSSMADSTRRPSINPEIVMTASDSPAPAPATPKSTPGGQSGTRKGLSSLLASVASAGRGLKRVGSAHSLQLPDEGAGGESLSKSLPPSPQQSPSPSRKPSLPLELSEDITTLLQTLLQQGTDQDDVMCFAKATGKTLYEELDLPQRKDKIQEMMNKLKAAISNESDVRFSLAKEMSSKDPSSHTKAAFLVGKSDEKTQALTVLMLHFCAGLQHIQDLEEQEREALNDEEQFMD